MSKVICEKDDLVAIADATRQATGSTETYNVPSLRNAVINTFAQGVGGGSADWAENDPDSPSYVKNRTHWVEEGEEVTILETTLTSETFDQNDAMWGCFVPFTTPVKAGDNCVVEWDGVKYNCTAKEGLFAGGDALIPALGNVDAATGTGDSGEPFAIIVVPAEMSAQANGMSAMIAPLYETDGSEPVTLKITTSSEIVHGLDPKYLPEGGFGWTEEGESDIIMEMTWPEQSDQMMVTSPPSTPLEPGYTYTFDINGTQYNCVVETITEDGITIPVAGNVAAVMGTGDTGEPFVYMDFSQVPEYEENDIYGGLLLLGEVSFPCTLQIQSREKIIHGIDPKYLPEGGFGWVEGKENTIVLPEITMEMPQEDDQPWILTPFNEPLVDGKTYTVVFNGETYNCVCSFFISDGIAIPVLGNIGAFSGTNNTGEPFIILYLTEEVKAAMGITGEPVYGMIQLLEGETFPVTFSITTDNTTYHKLNPRFLPDGGVGWTENKGAVKKELFSSTITETEYTEDTGGKVSESSGPLIPGETYIVNYNGTEYECLCESRYDEQVQRDVSFIGNMLPFGNEGETPGEPFYIVYTGENQVPGMEDEVASVVLRYDFEHTFPCTITVSTQGEKIHKIDEKYIPDSNEPVTDEEMLEALIESDLLNMVYDESGILADENNNIFEW